MLVVSDPFIHVMAEHEARYKDAVMHHTWGHLAPEPRKQHRGYILFTRGEYREEVCIRSAFQGVKDSPWFYNGLHDFIHIQLKRRDTYGRIYRFDGTVMMCKNGKFKFSGKVRSVRI